MVAASTVVSAKDRLPSCELIPKLLCCSERLLDKCLIGCSSYVATKCPHKMKNYNKINSSTIGMHQNLGSNSIFDQTTSISTSTPVTLFESNTRSIRRQPIKKPVILVEPNSSQKLTELPKGHHITSGIPQYEASVHKTYGNYIYLNQRYPITEISDENHSFDSGVESSRPSYYPPCPSKNLVDKLFLNCCQQLVLPNCHSLCTYGDRKHIAMETLSETMQQNVCNVKYFSRILSCTNGNRDNRDCCQFFGMMSLELGVDDSLRMCNRAHSGDWTGIVEVNDLICFSNRSVLICCSHVGLHTIN